MREWCHGHGPHLVRILKLATEAATAASIGFPLRSFSPCSTFNSNFCTLYLHLSDPGGNLQSKSLCVLLKCLEYYSACYRFVSCYISSIQASQQPLWPGTYLSRLAESSGFATHLAYILTSSTKKIFTNEKTGSPEILSSQFSSVLLGSVNATRRQLYTHIYTMQAPSTMNLYTLYIHFMYIVHAWIERMKLCQKPHEFANLKIRQPKSQNEPVAHEP